MKIAILAGGTGSIALQTGLSTVYGSKVDDLEIKVIVNAYDNGLSTGAVRKVFNGKILGPSDVRKNQTTKLKLEQPKSPYNEFLDIRFTATAQEAKSKCLEAISKLHGPNAGGSDQAVLIDAVEFYFNAPLALKTDYNDFSLANIIYAGLAAKNGNSLRQAARIMASLMGIADTVILNDDTSLFLGAIAADGTRVSDESDIVSWNNPDNPFVDVFFTDHLGEETLPVLCAEAAQAIQESDVLILSSGTQWSSLIPTYASKGFDTLMRSYQGKVIMVMNRVPDKDAPNQGADDIINQLVPRFFKEGQIHLIEDTVGDTRMTVKTSTTHDKLGSVNSFYMRDDAAFGISGNSSKHGPTQLAEAIGRTIFRDYLNSKTIMFDYDDTLVGRGNSSPRASATNIGSLSWMSDRFNFAVCTGNSIRAVKLIPYDQWRESAVRKITVYADGGINKYEYSTSRSSDEEIKQYRFVECIVPDAQFPRAGTKSADMVINSLRLVGIPTSKIENRGNVMLAIKPVDPDYREIVRNLALKVLHGSTLRVKSAGRTSIEIASPLVSKEAAVKEVLSTLGPDDTLVFIGDEFENGNDSPVLHLSKEDKRVKCLNVKNPTTTAMFMIALAHHARANKHDY